MLSFILSLIIAFIPVSTTPTTPTVPEAPTSASEVVASPTVQKDPYVWVNDVIGAAEINLPANVDIYFTNENNCGAKLGEKLYGVAKGGCQYLGVNGKEIILLSPVLANTEEGVHILLHEVAHALGYKNECDAEYFAHTWSNPEMWSYPECAAGEPEGDA